VPTEAELARAEAARADQLRRAEEARAAAAAKAQAEAEAAAQDEMMSFLRKDVAAPPLGTLQQRLMEGAPVS